MADVRRTIEHLQGVRKSILRDNPQYENELTLACNMSDNPFIGIVSVNMAIMILEAVQVDLQAIEDDV